MAQVVVSVATKHNGDATWGFLTTLDYQEVLFAYHLRHKRLIQYDLMI